MNFGLTGEQTLLRDAARDALGRLDTLAAARAALDGAAPLDVWPTARTAGWPGLLVGEEHGGAGLGAFDAMLVAQECGRRLSGAGLVGHLIATSVLAPASGRDSLLAALAAGERRAACAPAPGLGDAATLCAELADGGARLTGEAAFVPDLAGADVIVVVAEDAGGEPCAVLLEAGAAGVAVEPVAGYDATRPLAHLHLSGARGELLPAGPGEIARAWFLGQCLLAADALGVSEAALDLAVAYAKERRAFGRAIGSYQAIKHQLAEVLRRIGATSSLIYYAGYAADAPEAHDELALAASCARFAAEECADYATRTCIAVHGGIGATWEHDAPLYWRRSQLSRLLLGGRAGAGERVAEEIIRRAVAAAPTTGGTT